MYVALRFTKKFLMKIELRDMPVNTNFLTMTSISSFVVAKRCLPIWVHVWFAKVSWQNFMTERRSLNEKRFCHAIHWYAETNNKYIKDYNKNK